MLLPTDALRSALGGLRRQPQEGPFGLTGRTDATASNAQEIDVYVAMEQGLYLYDADRARLAPMLIGDLRPLAPPDRRAGRRPRARAAHLCRRRRPAGTFPRRRRARSHDAEMQKAYYFVDCGIVAANVYLFAAAAGLNAWFHDCDRVGLAKRLPLRAGRRVLFAQTVGFPG